MPHWLFWQKKTTGRVEGRGPDEGLHHVALAGGAVAKERHRGLFGAVALDAHRVADGVEGLAAEHDRRHRVPVLLGVPAAVADGAKESQHVLRWYPATPGDAVLAVGREREVHRREGPSGADLRGLLSLDGRPQCELTLTLE